MNENRFPDYLDHMQQAAIDACGFVEGLSKADFLEGKRSQQAVIMSLIIGEAATKVMDGYVEFTQAHLIDEDFMSHSRRKTAIVGHTTYRSEREDMGSPDQKWDKPC